MEFAKVKELPIFSAKFTSDHNALCINTIMQLFQYFSFQLNGTMKKMKKKPTSENNDAQDAQTFYVLKIFSLRI